MKSPGGRRSRGWKEGDWIEERDEKRWRRRERKGRRKPNLVAIVIYHRTCI